MTDTAYLNKHLLVLSSWAPPMIGGPALFYNLFSQFSSLSYHLVTDSRTMVTGIDPSMWLAGQYTFIDRPCASKEDIAKQVTEGKQTKTSKLILKMLKIPILGPLLHLAGLCRTIRLYLKAAKLIIIKDKPRFLLGISDTGAAIIATYLISHRHRIPYCYYFYDLYRGNQLPFAEKLVAHFCERSLLTRASYVIVNNEGTEEYYRNRYRDDIRIKIIHNSAFPEIYERERQTYNIKPPFEIIFTGNIAWPQKESIFNLIRAADLLIDLPLIIKIYSNRPPADIVAEIRLHPNIRISYAPYSKMPQIQSQASLLFLPLAWNTKNKDIIATATPGKFTDYLASGRPILVHAPNYSYISRCAKQYELGLVVDKNDVQLLADSIRNFLRNPSEAQKYIDNALKIFYQNHDAKKNAQKLMELLEVV